MKLAKFSKPFTSSVVSLFIALIITGTTVHLGKAEDGNEQQKLSAARELLEISGFERTAKTFMDEYARQTVEAWKSTLRPMNADTQRALEDEFSARLTRDYLDLLPEIAALYAKHFSIQEMNGLLEFYKSPLGQALTSKMPEFEKEMALQFYPRLFSSTERHWLGAVDQIRRQGRKL